MRQRVWQLSAPALVEMVLTSLMSAVNMMLVGRLGSTSIAAVGLPQQPFFFSLAIVVALNVGTTAIVARSIGAGKPADAHSAFRQNWVLSGLVGTLLGVFFFFCAQYVIVFMGGTGEVVAPSAQYLRIISISIPLFTISSTVLAALRGAGDTRTPMFVVICSNALVVVLGLPLIYGLGPIPRLEVAGAGWALLGARIYMVIASTWAAVRPKSTLRLTLAGFRFDGKLLRRTLQISIPSAIEQALLQAGLIMFIRSVAGMGTVIFAAHQIVGNILSLSWQPVNGFAVAATTLAGQSLGAGKPDEAEAAVNEAKRFGLMVAFTIAVALVLFGRFVLRLYTNDAAVIDQAVIALRIVAFVQPFQAIQLIQAGGLRGAGATRLPLISTATGIWVVRNIIAYFTLHVFQLGLVGAWMAVAGDQFTRYLFIRHLFRRGRWKRINIGLGA